MTTTLTLTTEQERAIQQVRQWLHTPGEPLFWLTGFAGTGKSTVAQYAADHERVAYLAPTGKAAAVLRRKGCADASTIHRALYTPKQQSSDRLRQLTEMLRKAHTPTTREQIQAQLAEEMRRLQRPVWEYRENNDLRHADLVVVDEASMVGERVLSDLLRTVRKVLCLGDPAQLPPVQASSPLLRRRPDAHLSQIHRHAAESGLLRAATYVREHGALPGWNAPDFHQYSSPETEWEMYRAADQVLVYSNATRQLLNRRFRARLGHDGLLAEGDRIVILRNSYDVGLYNGTTATVVACAVDPIWPTSAIVDLLSDEGPVLELAGQLEEDTTRWEYGSVPLTYGYALTVHKAQGSEWPRVLVYLPGGRAVSGSWLYTAITRASEDCTVVFG